MIVKLHISDDLREEKEKYYEISHEMDLTFAEMSGF